MDEKIVKIDGVEGTLTGPSLSSYPSSAPRRIIIIVHGVGGHRDYCYQQLLGREIPKVFPGVWTFRFDFRNCGNSDDTPDPRLGRRVAGSDCEDISSVVRHFVDEQGFELCAFVGHSRGFLAVLVWMNRMGSKYPPPSCLINCSGRFNTYKYLTSTLEEEGTKVLRDNGHFVVWRRHGKYEPQWVPLEEMVEFGQFDADELVAGLDRSIDVLTIFGDHDMTVPVEDGGMWANSFAKAGHRHVLEFVPEADHNFYDYRGGRDANGKKITLAQNCVDCVVSFLGSIANTSRAQEISRWQQVEGVENFRDFGGYDGVLPGILYRSAVLSNITERGIETLKHDLRIKNIIDLRSPMESEHRPTPDLAPEVIVNHAPVSKENWSPEGLIQKYSDNEGEFGFVRVYTGMMVAGVEAFSKALTCLRDYPQQPILIHCTAGKDRTGILCALILLLAGVNRELVARDYALTTQGLTAFRERQLKVARQVGGVDVNGLARLLSSTYETMVRVIDAIEENGGARKYFTQSCGFSNEDLDTIVANLRGTSTASERL